MSKDKRPEAPLEALSEGLSEEADIAIIGGGLTGLCTALFLAWQQPLWSILLLESADTANRSAAGGAEPGFQHRQIALAESSRRLFQNIGLWPDIEGQCAAITEIQVSDRGHPG
ncbi:MAG: FAD-dependent oxidoreductase, partial [Porticoccaceae bacterium]|nr:FAD-dependent oxidoreductase [Porticoccaceae bacterium]